MQLRYPGISLMQVLCILIPTVRSLSNWLGGNFSYFNKVCGLQTKIKFLEEKKDPANIGLCWSVYKDFIMYTQTVSVQDMLLPNGPKYFPYWPLRVYLCSWTNTLEKHTGSRKTCYREVNIVVTVQCYILTVLLPVFNTPIHLPNKPALWWENQTTGCPRWKPNCLSLRINNDPSTSPLLSKYYLLPRLCIYFWKKLKSSCTLILLFVIEGDTSRT